MLPVTCGDSVPNGVGLAGELVEYLRTEHEEEIFGEV